ncbi:ADYC domain-containing protein [Sorangium sp. So ce1097]|uniref:ADYC domain-containing protein n=1 Tax=Sorangium sp. So ce1097 TaxID=3133330 RepID=UPI003F6033C8
MQHGGSKGRRAPRLGGAADRRTGARRAAADVSLCILVATGAACTAVDADVEETLAGRGGLAAWSSDPIEEAATIAASDASLRECTKPRVGKPGKGNYRSHNGTGLHGRWDPGPHYGDLEPSEVPRRFDLASITKDGRPIDDVHVSGGKLHGRFRGGPDLVDGDWVGAVMDAHLLCTYANEESRFQARIDAVSSSGYLFKIHDPARRDDLGGASWRPACTAPLDAPEAVWATPFAEVWDENGIRRDSSASFTLACPMSAIAKCDRMGYGGDADTERDADARLLRQACTRTLRADYLGDGEFGTRDGVLIDIEDNRGIQVREQEGDVPLLDLEAVWSPTGAVCVNYPRLSGNTVPIEELKKCEDVDAAPDPSRPDLIRSWSCGPGSTCERQYSSVFVKNWPASGGLTQWSNVIVVNPSPAEAAVELTVLSSGGGGPLGTVTVAIPGYGVYNSFGDPRWRGIDGVPTDESRPSYGWIALASDRPVVATHRTALRAGSTWNAPARLVEDEPFLTEPSRRLFASYYLKRWPEAGGKTLWSNVVVNNPAARQATIQVRIHGADGGLHEFHRTVPARGAWNSHGDTDWLAVPDVPTKVGAPGWVEIRSDEPVVATSRIVHRSGSTYDAPVTLLDDMGLTGARSAARRLAASAFLRNVPATGTMTQWSSLIVNNPHPEQVTITVTVHRNDEGPDLARFTKTIPPFGAFSADGDPDWASVPATGSGGRSTGDGGRSAGWVEISADLPVFGVSRVMLREGAAPSSPVVLFNDEPLAAPSSGSLVSGLYIKNVPGAEGLTQWSAPVVNNLSAEPATTRVRILTTDGSLLGEIERTIPAKSAWDAASDPGWQALPHSEAAHLRSIGWVELIPSRPWTALLATNRLTQRRGTTGDAPIALYDATPFVRARD